jgi:hypothetical protein
MTHNHPLHPLKKSVVNKLATMSKPNPAVVRAAIFEVVENQLRDGTPPETKQTFERLVREGYPEQEAKRLIAVVVTTEIFDVLKQNRPYNQARFVTALHRLPKLPYE